MAESHEAQDTPPPSNFGMILFPGFQLLDATGPLDILNLLAERKKITVNMLSHSLEPVSTAHPLFPNAHKSQSAQSIVPTHTFADPPKDLEVLLIPGGDGTRTDDTAVPVIEFLKQAYPKLRYIISVCTGAHLLARAGLLDGRKATTAKSVYKRVTSASPQVQWVHKARWVVDGNIWTSAGLTAGIDITYAFISATWGEEIANSIAIESEYTRAKDADDDPFAAGPI